MNLMRLRTAIVCAMKYWQKQDLPLHAKIISLRNDIINSPSHVFGSHEKCSSYFCKHSRENENSADYEKDFNYVPELLDCKMFEVKTRINFIKYLICCRKILC